MQYYLIIGDSSLCVFSSSSNMSSFKGDNVYQQPIYRHCSLTNEAIMKQTFNNAASMWIQKLTYYIID